MNPIVTLAFGYLAGSIPFADLVGRLRGLDVAHEGSGNVGAANVARLTGRWVGAVVLVLDIGKALVAVGLAGHEPVAQLAAAWGVILGHDYPMWLGFLGGRGEAVSLATGFVLAPQATFAVFPLLVVGWFTNRLALSWLVAVTAYPAVAYLLSGPITAVFAAGVAILTATRRLVGSPGIATTSFAVAWKDRLLHDREPE